MKVQLTIEVQGKDTDNKLSVSGTPEQVGAWMESYGKKAVHSLTDTKAFFCKPPQSLAGISAPTSN